MTGLTSDTTYYFAIETADEVPNWSGVSNGPSAHTSDVTAPAAVTNLATSGPTSSTITLTWTAPGDDNNTGTATTYDIRYARSAINSGNWASATTVTGEPTPAVAGTAQTFTVTGLSSSTTYYFAIETADEVPNWSGVSNSPSGTTSAAVSNLLTNGDFQTGTAFTSATYTAGTSSDGVWYASSWTNTANAGDAGSGDYAGKVNNNYSDLRLFQGVTAPGNGTNMNLSFKYICPSGGSGYIRVYGLTSGQLIQPWAGGTLNGTQLFNYTFVAGSWTTLTNQAFSVSGTFAKLVVYADASMNASICVDDFILAQAGGDTTAPAAVTNLATTGPTSSTITLTWTAPGDDNNTGTATSYDIRYGASALTEGNWASATQVTGEPTPQVAGTNQTFTVTGLSASSTYYFAIKASDEVPNVGAISNSPSGTTQAASDTTAPAAVTNLATSNPQTTTITLTWTAPGDDNNTGTATSYDIRYRTGGAVDDSNWASATTVTGEPNPQVAGTNQTFTVTGLSADDDVLLRHQDVRRGAQRQPHLQLAFGHDDLAEHHQPADQPGL